MSVVSLLAQYSYSSDLETQPGSGGMGAFAMLFWLAFIVAIVAGLWKTFQKAGHPGWAAIIPIYNTYILLKIAGRPEWWLVLYLIPVVNLIVHIIVSLDVARAFGKSDMFGIFGLWLFSFVGFLMLGFGSDKYKGAPTH
ncbi:MAG TPA: DUF5684 domain-containing protein [Verrucomicrobiae bacterium]|nr:DUF5684 domain-containing protein [Verrucomicrobiae bacterium]